MSELDIVIELQPWVTGSQPGGFLEQCRTAVVPLVEGLLTALGIPGRTRVNVRFEPSLPAHRIMRITVDGRSCPYPDELMRWTAGYVTGALPGLEVPIIDAWKRLCREAAARADRPVLVPLVAQSCLEILKSDTSRLIGQEQVREYAEALTPPVRLAVARDIWPPPASWLGPVLRTLLKLRLSLSDGRGVATVLADAESRADVGDTVEHLVARLRAPACEIELARDTEDCLLALGRTALEGMFTSLREQLFNESGLDYPEFQLRVADDLKPGAFAFRIGALRTIPIHALGRDLCLVNDTAKRLQEEKIPAIPSLNPASAYPAAVVRRSERERLGPDRVSWDAQEHFMLCLAAALREHAEHFVDRSFTRARMEFVATYYPATARALTRLGYTDVRLTPLLRELAGEGISLRNIRRILDLVVEHAPSRRDDRLLMERLRRGLARQITEKHARGTDTVVAYLVDVKIEEIAGALAGSAAEDSREAILSAVRNEIAHLPPTVQRPPLLTTERARPGLRRILAPEFPRLSVIAFDDLNGDANVQPVARIAL